VHRPLCALFALAGFTLHLGNLYPVPEGPYGKLPYIYLAYLAAGMLWFLLRSRSVQGQLGDF